jgi:RNA polymerase sigma-70 factor (ECF subfamily)
VIALHEEGSGEPLSVPWADPPGQLARQRAQPHDSQTADFNQFYAANFRGLTVQLRAYTGDLGQAQDLVQDAFCRALSRWEKVSGYEDPVAWVRRVAWNLANSRWRRVRTARTYARLHRDEHAAGPSPDRVALDAALAMLPQVLRRAVVMHYLADMSVTEIATHEGVPEGTIKSRLHRGRTAMAAQLNDSGQEERDV